MISGLVLRVPVHLNLFLKQVWEQSSSEPEQYADQDSWKPKKIELLEDNP
jgi:hypothetical protein